MVGFGLEAVYWKMGPLTTSRNEEDVIVQPDGVGAVEMRLGFRRMPAAAGQMRPEI